MKMISFFKQSIFQMYTNVGGDAYKFKMKLPFMRYRERDIFEEIILNLKPGHVLEWGSGFSTLYFSKKIPEQSTWTSIEHAREWYDKLCPQIDNPRVTLKLIEPKTDPEHPDLDPDFTDYIHYPAQQHHLYDLIIVDGRKRNQCLKLSEKILSPMGIVIMHDANRGRYNQYYQQFRHQILFTDYRRSSGGIWIGSHDREIDTVLDTSAHRERWRLMNNFVSKVLSL